MQLANIVGWLASAACLLSLVYGLYEVNLSVVAGAAYSSLSHSAWALGLGWVVVACATGNGGINCKYFNNPNNFIFSRIYKFDTFRNHFIPGEQDNLLCLSATPIGYENNDHAHGLSSTSGETVNDSCIHWAGCHVLPPRFRIIGGVRSAYSFDVKDLNEDTILPPQTKTNKCNVIVAVRIVYM